MKEVGAATIRELFDNALTLLQWAAKETAKGRTIASVDDKKLHYSELQMPILSNMRKTPLSSG